MGRLHVTQIQGRLDDTVNDHIDTSDFSSQPNRIAGVRRSRGLAAFIIMKLTGATPEVAAASVTDQGGDNGIDAVIALPLQHRILMVQSKWAEDSKGSAEKADILKFREGINDFVSGNWDKFGTKLQGKRGELEPLLYDPMLKIDMVFCHLGTGDLSDESQELIDDYLKDMNNPTEIGTFTYLNQGAVHRMLIDDAVHAKVTLDVELSDWGCLEGEPEAFFGHVSGETVAKWYNENKANLLSENVRVLIPDSEVNEGMLKTLETEPEKFWYFNNGITVLCDSVRKAPAGGSDRRTGQFAVSGASVVNGAQTAGSLARFSASGGDLSAVRVLVRFISLENAPSGFGKDVTRATNTQNRIGGREFVALDPEQDRLRNEFAVSGLTYAFRTGEATPEPADGCGIVDATIALACLHSPQLATQAKREISRLWDDISRAPYKTLFNSTTNYIRVRRSILVLQRVEELLKAKRNELDGRQKLVATHGNRALLHLVFRQLKTDAIDDPDEDWGVQLAAIDRIFDPTLGLMLEIVEKNYAGYPASLFKNASKVQKLADSCLAVLAADPR